MVAPTEGVILVANSRSGKRECAANGSNLTTLPVEGIAAEMTWAEQEAGLSPDHFLPSEIKALGHCAPLVKAQGAQGWIDTADSSVGAKAPTP